MFYSHEKPTLKKKTLVLPTEKFLSHVLPRNVIMLHHLITRFSLLNYYLSSGHLQEVKNKRTFQTFTCNSKICRGQVHGCFQEAPKYSDLTWKCLIFWKTGRWGEVVATGGSTVYTCTCRWHFTGKCIPWEKQLIITLYLGDNSPSEQTSPCTVFSSFPAMGVNKWSPTRLHNDIVSVTD